MKLSDFLLYPEKEIQIDDTLALTPYSPPDTDDPEVERFISLLVQAGTQNEVRMVLKLAFDAWAVGELEIDEVAFRELDRLVGRTERVKIPF